MPDRPPSTEASAGWSTYALFGVKLHSDYPFGSFLTPAEGPADLSLTSGRPDQLPSDWQRAEPTFVSPIQTSEGIPIFRLFRGEGYDVWRAAEVVDFYVWPSRVLYYLRDPDLGYWVESHFLSTILSYWLEVHLDVRALHAAGLIVQERAIGILFGDAHGKSTLAAEFLQAGYPLLTDDILPVREIDGRFMAQPGFPQLRLWPREQAPFGINYHELPRVAPDVEKRRQPVGERGVGRFWSAAAPLAALYLGERRDPGDEDTSVTIRHVSQREAVIELVRNSFTRRTMEIIGLQARRLDTFVRLARQVPMRRLTYPHGFHHLPAVRQAILDDLAGLG